MAQLFKKNIIKEKLENFEISNFKEKLEIVKKWHNDYYNGTLKTDKSEDLKIIGEFCKVLKN